MEHTQTFKKLSLTGIGVMPDRKRSIHEENLDRLCKSMESIGLINPITVRERAPNAGYIIIAGLHRFEAAKRLKWENIDTIVLEGIEALDAEEIEIRENIDRENLTPAETSIQFARLKAIKEQKHRLKAANQYTKPESAVSQLERKHTDKQSNTAKVVSKETGRSASAIERDDYRVKSIPNIADVIGTSLDSGVELDALVSIGKGVEQDEIINRAKAGEKVSARTELKKKQRSDKEKELAKKQTALPDKKYGVIYADPEWKFETYSENGMDRSADNHYPTSNTESIMERGVSDISASDCVLFLWATVPMLQDALSVMNAWGFTYKSQAVWVKDRIGTGYWFRNAHEILLVGTKGNVPAPAMGAQWKSVIEAPVGAHSEKPVAAYEMIEAYFPNLPKIELNARNSRDGWDSWGYEAQ